MSSNMTRKVVELSENIKNREDIEKSLETLILIQASAFDYEKAGTLRIVLGVLPEMEFQDKAAMLIRRIRRVSNQIDENQKKRKISTGAEEPSKKKIKTDELESQLSSKKTLPSKMRVAPRAPISVENQGKENRRKSEEKMTEAQINAKLAMIVRQSKPQIQRRQLILLEVDPMVQMAGKIRRSRKF